MSTPVENILLSEEELKHYAELREILQTANSPGWARIMKRLEEMAEQAREDMIGAGDKPDIVLAPLARRWTQREAMVRDIKEFVESCQTEKDQILKSLDERNNANAEDRTA